MNQTTPAPKPVTWTGYLALTFLLALPLAVLTVRSGAWQQGLLLYAISCLGAFILLALSVILLLLPRYRPWRAKILGWGLLTIPGSLLLLSLVSGRGDYPPIHDISTDLEDPPLFTAAQQQRGPGSNSLEPDDETVTQQRASYPELDTLVIARPYDEAFDRALQVAREMGWEVYHEDRNAGVFEAVDTTAIMNFRDDVAVRLRTNAEGTLVDVRSVSRVGIGDLGANAKRIREFLSRMQG